MVLIFSLFVVAFFILKMDVGDTKDDNLFIGIIHICAHIIF